MCEKLRLPCFWPRSLFVLKVTVKCFTTALIVQEIHELVKLLFSGIFFQKNRMVGFVQIRFDTKNVKQFAGI